MSAAFIEIVRELVISSMQYQYVGAKLPNWDLEIQNQKIVLGLTNLQHSGATFWTFQAFRFSASDCSRTQ